MNKSKFQVRSPRTWLPCTRQRRGKPLAVKEFSSPSNILQEFQLPTPNFHFRAGRPSELNPSTSNPSSSTSFYKYRKNSWNPLSPCCHEYPCKSRHQPKIGLASQSSKILHSQMTQATRVYRVRKALILLKNFWLTRAQIKDPEKVTNRVCGGNTDIPSHFFRIFNLRPSRIWRLGADGDSGFHEFLRYATFQYRIGFISYLRL